jgi:hypothetical protein
VTARELLERSRRELAPVEQAIRTHRYLDAPPPEKSLRAFAGEQFTILSGDRRSFAYLAGRFPEPPAGELFLALAQGEGQATRAAARTRAVAGDGPARPRGARAAAGLSGIHGVRFLARAERLAGRPRAFVPGQSCRLGNRASRRLVEMLAGSCDTSFFEFFAEPAPGFEQQALATADQGLAAGDSPERARRAARLLQAYELLFWHALADGL